MSEAPPVERKWDFDRVVRVIITVASFVIFFALVRYLADVLIPFTVALLLAFLLNPVVTALEVKLGRTAAVLTTVFGTGVVVFAVSLMLVYVAGKEIMSLRDLAQDFVRAPTAEDVQGVRQAFDEFVDKQENPTIRRVLLDARAELAELDLQNFEVVPLLRRVAGTVMPGVVGLVSGVLSFVLGLTVLVVIVLYLVFLLMDYPKLAGTWREFLPPKYRTDIIGFTEEFHLAMSRYFRGQFIIAMITGVIFAIGFSMIGLRMAVLLGLFIGLLNMVPYLQIAGLIPALFFGLVHGAESNMSVMTSLILVLVVFAVAQLIQDGLLTPKIMGQTVGLRPVILLLGVFIWGKLLGFLGVVLAIPLTCLGIAYYRRSVLGDMTAKAIEAE